MAGHSRSKNGVASLAYVPSIHGFRFIARLGFHPVILRRSTEGRASKETASDSRAAPFEVR
jgi:hypothetical protein